MIPRIFEKAEAAGAAGPGKDWSGYARVLDALDGAVREVVGGSATVVRDWSVGGRYKADLALLDTRTNRPLALFEVRFKRDDDTIRKAVEQLRSFRTALGNEDVPLYVVLAGKSLEYRRVPPEGKVTGLQELAPEEALPNPDRLLTQGRASAKATHKVERRSTVRLFMVVCWLLAAALLVVLLLDMFTKFSLTPARLSLIGAIAGLVVIPFAGKLKVLGLEFERAGEGGGPAVAPGVVAPGSLVPNPPLPVPGLPAPDIPLDGRLRSTAEKVEKSVTLPTNGATRLRRKANPVERA